MDVKEESEMSKEARRLVPADVVERRRENICEALGIETDYSWTQIIIEIKRLVNERDHWMSVIMKLRLEQKREDGTDRN